MAEHSLFISYQAQSDLFWDGMPRMHLVELRLLAIADPGLRAAALAAARRAAAEISLLRLRCVLSEWCLP